MVGDTMDTDILGGVGLGYRTILVMSGGTKLGDLGDYAFSPDMVVDSVADIPDNIAFPDGPNPGLSQNGTAIPVEQQRSYPVESVVMPS